MGLDSIDRAFLNRTIADCQASWLEEHHEDPIMAEPMVINKVLGWARIQYCGPYSGELEAQPPSWRAMKSWHLASGSKLVDLRVFQVLEAFRLQRPPSTIARGHGFSRPKHVGFEVTAALRDELLAAPLSGSELTMADVLASFGMRPSVSAMQVPACFAVLVVAGSFPVLMVDRLSRFSCEDVADRWAAWRQEVVIPRSRLPPADLGSDNGIGKTSHVGALDYIKLRGTSSFPKSAPDCITA